MSRAQTRCIVAVMTILAIFVVDTHRSVAYFGVHRFEPVNVPGRLFVLAVGINEYPTGGMIPNLRFAEDDASAVANAFAGQTHDAFAQVIARSLLGHAATVTGLRNALHDIALKSGPNDTLIFYYAGSGFHPQGAGQNDYAFNLSDTKLTSLGNLSGTLSSQDLATLLFQIPTQKQVIILDSCDTRNALDAIRDAMDGPERPGLQHIDRRIALLGVDGTAFEVPNLKHGLLTYSLLQGLNGGADVDHTGLISEARLEGYLTWKLPEVAATQGLANQLGENLYSYSTLRDMVISRPSAPAKPAEALRGNQVVPIPNSSQDPGKDYALFVATDRYAKGWDPLDNPVRDAHAIGTELIAQYGYDPQNVFYLDNPTEDAFLDKIEDLHNIHFGAHDRLLVYYAGHGFTNAANSEGYAVFADTRNEVDDPHHHTALAYGYLSDLLHAVPVNHILLLIDSCYGGNFARTGDFANLLSVSLPTASRNDLIVRAMDHKSRIYLASGDAHHAVSDGAVGQHSPFAQALLVVLAANAQQDGLLHVANLYNTLSVLPSKPTSGYFFPGASESGADFLFVPRDNSIAAAAPVPTFRPIPAF